MVERVTLIMDVFEGRTARLSLEEVARSTHVTQAILCVRDLWVGLRYGVERFGPARSWKARSGSPPPSDHGTPTGAPVRHRPS